MAQHHYSEINLHIVWHTKLSQPLLVDPLEETAHKALTQKCRSFPGVWFHSVGGIETHIHIAVSIAPTVVISDFIGQLKGYSAHAVDQVHGAGSKVLQWQEGYGVVSFGTRDLEWVLAYIRNQKQHHAARTTHERLEQIETLEPVGRRRTTGGRASSLSRATHPAPFTGLDLFGPFFRAGAEQLGPIRNDS